MFIMLTGSDGKTVWFNTAHIRKFYTEHYQYGMARHPERKTATVLDLTYGSAVVYETPEEIMDIITKTARAMQK